MTARNRRRGTGAWIPGAVSALHGALYAWAVLGWVVLLPLAILKGTP